MQVLNLTIGALLAQTAAQYPQMEAVSDPERLLTYRELDALVSGTAKGLLAWGVRPGEHVGIWARETVQMLVCFYALWRIGAVAVPFCTGYRDGELAACTEAADITRFLAGDSHKGGDFQDVYGNLPEKLPWRPITRFADLQDLIELGKDLPDAALARAAAAVTPEDADTILFTSGSTGAYKPVLTNHLARVNVALEQAWALHVESSDRFCCVLPMYHCFSITASVLAALTAGACVCFAADTRSQTVLSLIESRRCTVINAVPTLFSALLRRQAETGADVSTLRTGIIGGSTYSPLLFERICRQFSMTLLSSLGQSEATAGITACALEDPLEVRAGTLGRFFPHLEGSIRDIETGLPLPQGEVGEICVRGLGVMTGYYRQPQETARVIDSESWLHTGDLGSIDRQGNLIYEGRLKELIIRGGENIYPVELETVIAKEPRVAQVKVIGVPDVHYIEEGCACVAAREPLTEEEVRALVAAEAACFKVPRYVVFFDRLPLTSTGKIDGGRLRVMAMERLKLT